MQKRYDLLAFFGPVCLVAEDNEVALPGHEEELERHAAELVAPLRHRVDVPQGGGPGGGPAHQVQLARAQHQLAGAAARRRDLLNNK
jgi:hypothetical protein